MKTEILEISKLKQMLANFAAERDWQQFHNPKNLSIALSVEAGELLEIFQWLTPTEAEEIVSNQEKYQRVQDELADVLVYSVRLADRLNIDLNSAIENKMKKNIEKYPVNLAKGTAKKYDEF